MHFLPVKRWAPEMRHYTEGPIGQQHQFPVCPVGLPSPQLYYLVECVLATAKMSKARGDHFLHTHALRQYCCYAHFSPTLVSIERTAFFFRVVSIGKSILFCFEGLPVFL